MANTRYLYLIDKLKECGVEDGASVVDCGCGEGVGSNYLIEAGYDVHPFDVSQEMIDYCENEIGIHVFKGDILNMSLDDNFADVFVCSETLEHISKKDTLKAANEIKRVCILGGYICITVPEDKYICLANKKHKQYLGYEDLVKVFSLSCVFRGRYCKNERKCNLVVIFRNE